jgi:RNA 3'-terminal phosphate cyclase (ATP)
VLRTALALSVATGEPVRVVHVRAGRPRPGLRRQHLAALEVAARVGRAWVAGNRLGSTEVGFTPGGLDAGPHRVDVGSAGSVGLVLHTAVPPLFAGAEPASLAVHGGTHNEGAPPFEQLARNYAPALARTGGGLSLALRRHGFAPAGGGSATAEVRPAVEPAPVDLRERGSLEEVRATALLTHLPRHVADRELAVVARELADVDPRLEVEPVPGDGPGNVLFVEVRCARHTEVLAAFGRKGRPAERVAEEAAGAARAYLDSGAGVGPRLGDQRVVPLARAAGGRFTTVATSDHLRAGVAVIQALTDARVSVAERGAGPVSVEVVPASGGRARATDPAG